MDAMIGKTLGPYRILEKIGLPEEKIAEACAIVGGHRHGGEAQRLAAR